MELTPWRASSSAGSRSHNEGAERAALWWTCGPLWWTCGPLWWTCGPLCWTRCAIVDVRPEHEKTSPRARVRQHRAVECQTTLKQLNNSAINRYLSQKDRNVPWFSPCPPTLSTCSPAVSSLNTVTHLLATPRLSTRGGLNRGLLVGADADHYHKSRPDAPLPCGSECSRCAPGLTW